MPTFQYEALNGSGQQVKAEIDAGTSDEAISKVRSQGYFVTKIREKAAKKTSKSSPGDPTATAAPATPAAARRKKKKKGLNELSFSVGKVSQKILVQFTRQLSTLQDAGLPILRSIKILHQQQKPGLMRDALDDVANDVEGGTTLSESFSRHPRVFDKLYVNMVQAGETGGVLDVILQRLAEFMEKSQKAQTAA